MTHLADDHVVGRKVHRCCLCGEDIPKGERHRVHVYVDGDGFSRTRYHAECDKVTEVDKWQPWDFEELGDVISFRERRDELRAEGRL